MRPRLVLLLLVVAASLGLAQGKKKPVPRDTPKILMAKPFGIGPGKTVEISLRGLKLENAKEVKVAPKGSVKLLSKKKVAVPNQQDPLRVGDSEVRIELTVPADVAGDALEVVVATPAGESPGHRVLIDRTPPVPEKEPNDGFKQAQAVAIGQTIQGSISRAQDVDVYRFEVKAGQKVVVEVMAARLGSALDSFLTIHDADGQIVATSDDLEETSDSRLELTGSKTGSYFASVTDAHDQGGAMYDYRLSIRVK